MDKSVLMTAIEKIKAMWPASEEDFVCWLKTEVGMPGKYAENYQMVGNMQEQEEVLTLHNLLSELKKAWDEDLDGDFSEFCEDIGIGPEQTCQFEKYFALEPVWAKDEGPER